MAESDQHLSDEELISAYCDGELRGAELARAEELLANRPECRQLLEEYRALRSRLQEVPRRTLGSDFSQRVLRRAERDMLVTAAPAESYAYATSAPPKKSSRWPQGRRPWVYVGMAAAAALVVMLVESKDLTRGPAQQLAKHEPLPANAEISAPRSTDASSFGANRKAKTAASAPADRTASSAAPVSPPQQIAPGQAPTSSSPGAMPSKDGQVETLLDDVEVKQVLDELGWPAISDQLARQAAVVEQQQGGRLLPADVLVVECDISSQNRTPDPMVASFLDNSIAVDARSTAVESRLAKVPDAPAKLGDKLVGTNAAPPDPSSQDPVEVFFVVATPEQLEATLADLGNRPGVSYKLLTENRLDRAGISRQENRAGRIQRPMTDTQKEKTPAPTGQAIPGLAGQSQSLAKAASTQGQMQQGRAQRLDIPEKLRLQLGASPAAGQQKKFAAAKPRVADQRQPSPPAVALSKRELDEAAKSSVAEAPPVSAGEPATYQRALFIVRIRPQEKK